MAKYEVLSRKQIVRICHKNGFYETTQRGTHIKFQHENGKSFILTASGGREVNPMIWRRLVKEFNLEY